MAARDLQFLRQLTMDSMDQRWCKETKLVRLDKAGAALLR